MRQECLFDGLEYPHILLTNPCQTELSSVYPSVRFTFCCEKFNHVPELNLPKFLFFFSYSNVLQWRRHLLPHRHNNNSNTAGYVRPSRKERYVHSQKTIDASINCMMNLKLVFVFLLFLFHMIIKKFALCLNPMVKSCEFILNKTSTWPIYTIEPRRKHKWPFK